ncbi:NUDIX hydrolase [Candidatus Dojkabacteria bacterium]|nr:NUDIX hydrolase [Candidatus Dojkabacteria bacterium]
MSPENDPKITPPIEQLDSSRELYIPELDIIAILGTDQETARDNSIGRDDPLCSCARNDFLSHQLTLAHTRYNIPRYVLGPNPFGCNIFFYASRDTSSTPLPIQINHPAILIGASLPIYQHGSTFYLRQRPNGTHAGKYEIPGGHYDGFYDDIAGLREIQEEMRLTQSQCSESQPLGTFLVTHGGTDSSGTHVIRSHLCLTWITYLNPDNYKPHEQTQEGWEPFTVDQIRELYANGLLTPFAYLAFKAINQLD